MCVCMCGCIILLLCVNSENDVHACMCGEGLPWRGMCACVHVCVIVCMCGLR